jgi:predicted phage baseplate assembly protein
VSVALPAPNLDDRRFQDLVDDAKRLVQQKCPEWTDHNVSDPGVTLIELFAWMTEQVLYRLNRVPDKNYVKFLDLIGVRLFPPTAARAHLTFWLSSPRDEVLTIPAETEVATARTERDEAVVFATERDAAIVPCSLERVASTIKPDAIRSHTSALDSGKSFFCFDKTPKPGDTLLLGLSNAVPSCAVALRFDCAIEGIGIDPRNPPLVWEAWNGSDWAACELERDETGGLNRAGDVVVHVPASHAASVISKQRAGWLRCRVVDSEEGQPSYSASPQIEQISAFTVGGTVPAVNSELVEDETLGMSEGVSGERFPLQRRPVVATDAEHVLEIAAEDGWRVWTEVTSFADSGQDDEHFVLDAAAGDVVLGPAVRTEDGQMRRFGAAPAKGATLRLKSYRTGGGRQGNVTARTLTVLRSSIPFVASVENRHPARGGVDGEEIDNAKVRGPMALRTGNRAVTLEDYEELARQAAPEVARVRCVQAGDGAEAGGLRVLVVPAVDGPSGRVRFEQLIPSEEAVAKIARYLDERRVLGARVAIEPPVYQGVTVVAKLRAHARVDPARLQSEALETLYRYFGPLTGGPDRTGWPFGRTVIAGEVFGVLQSLKGTELVEEAHLFPADARTGERGKSVDRIELPRHALVFPYEHRVLVEGS